MTKAERTRERILDAALETVSREGFGALSMGALARQLDMSKTGVALAFGNREALQLAALEAVIANHRLLVIEPARSLPRGLARLERLLGLWLDWSIESGYPGGCPLLPATHEWDDLEGPLRDRLVQSFAAWRGYLAGQLRHAAAAGEIRQPPDAEQTVFQLFGIIMTAHHRQRLLRAPDWRARADAAIESLLQPLRLPAQARPATQTAQPD